MPRSFRIFALLFSALMAIGVIGAGVAFAAAPAPLVASTCLAATQTVAAREAALRAALAEVPNDTAKVATARRALLDAQRDRDLVCGRDRGGNRHVSCADYNRDGVFDIPRSDPRYLLELDLRRNGVACERTTTSTDTATTVNGACSTITTTTTEYADAVRRWNDTVLRLRPLVKLSVSDVEELNRVNRDRVSWENRYTRDRARVTGTSSNTTCATPPPVTVVVEKPPVTYTAPQIVRSPVGGAETGDGSTE